MLAQQLDERSAVMRRDAVVQLHLGKIKRFQGTEIYVVTQLGIVVALGPSLTLYPWHVVVSFTYHHDDVAARRVIQGF